MGHSLWEASWKQPPQLQLRPNVGQSDMTGTPVTFLQMVQNSGRICRQEPDIMSPPQHLILAALVGFHCQCISINTGKTSGKVTVIIAPSRKKRHLLNKLQVISHLNLHSICFVQVCLQLSSETSHFNVTNPCTYLFFSLNVCLQETVSQRTLAIRFLT